MSKSTIFGGLMITFRRTALASGFAAMAASPAFAEVAQATLEPSVTVVASCTASVDGGGMVFGAVDVNSGLPDDAMTHVRTACSSGTTWSAKADVGLGPGATYAVRKMTNGTGFLNYSLYISPGRSATFVWGIGPSGAAGRATASTGLATAPIYGRVFAGQTSVPVGAYTDTVTVTVSY